MPNLCQPCGRRHIPSETARMIWLPDFYAEWDSACPNGCGDKREYHIANGQTGEELVITLNEFDDLLNGRCVDLTTARQTVEEAKRKAELVAAVIKYKKRLPHIRAEQKRKQLVNDVMAYLKAKEA